MDLPAWVIDAIRVFDAPDTGQVTITVERYCGGITKAKLGAFVEVKPPTKK